MSKQFQRRYFLEIDQSEDLKKMANQKQELPVVAMFGNGSKQNI